MRRRDFIKVIGNTVAWPLAARAQQPAMPLIGYLHPGSPEPNSFLTEAFHKGLGEAGYVEGRNVVVEYRWAKYQYDRLPAMATDLVRLKVAVIAAMGGTFSGLAAVR